MLGGEDYEAPSVERSRRVESLFTQAKPFTSALYLRAEHGVTLFEAAADKPTRLSTRYAPHDFEMMRDFARDG